MGPILSQPVDFVQSSDERASNTSESENDKLHKHNEGRGRVLMFGREKELPAKTEGIGEFSLSSVRGCTGVVEKYSGGDGTFLA